MASRFVTIQCGKWASGLFLALGALTMGTPAAAASWQKPEPQECAMGPEEECNVEKKCPADMPYIVTAGGGMPVMEPPKNSVVMTMSLPTNENTWRVRWKNMSKEDSAKVRAVVRIKCAATKEEAGW